MVRDPSDDFSVRLDTLDEAIIGALQEDGRLTFREVAERVGLSEPAARKRYNRLRDAGALRVVAVTDPLAFGRRTVALIGIRVDEDAREIASRLAEVRDIEYVVLSSGSFDIFAEVVCESEQRLLDIVNDHIRSMQGVTYIESFIYLRIAKQVFSWGGRSER